MGYKVEEIEATLDKLNVENFLESGTDISNLALDKKESLRKYSFYINFDNELNYSLPKGLRDTETMYLEVKNLTRKFENIKNFDNFYLFKMLMIWELILLLLQMLGLLL